MRKGMRKDHLQPAVGARENVCSRRLGRDVKSRHGFAKWTTGQPDGALSECHLSISGTYKDHC